jgi:gamma-glutamylcyclotransferase (GGCT)/AIG2-like uncharacterized protein YtfP
MQTGEGPVTVPLRVFVYGTLKRGQRNFDVHCHDAVSIREAAVRGRLLRRHTGTPILSLPPQAILALGTSDPDADVQAQCRTVTPGPAPDDPRWLRVRGELLEFPDAAQALGRLDALEEYHPGTNSSLYDRVLVALADPPHLAVWTYTIPRHLTEDHYEAAPDPALWTPDW